MVAAGAEAGTAPGAEVGIAAGTEAGTAPGAEAGIAAGATTGLIIDGVAGRESKVIAGSGMSSPLCALAFTLPDPVTATAHKAAAKIRSFLITKSSTMPRRDLLNKSHIFWGADNDRLLSFLVARVLARAAECILAAETWHRHRVNPDVSFGTKMVIRNEKEPAIAFVFGRLIARTLNYYARQTAFPNIMTPADKSRAAMVSSKTSRFSIGQKAILLTVVPLIFQIAVLCAVTFLLGQAEVEASRERQSRAISDQTNVLLRKYADCSLNMMMFRTTKEHRYAHDYQEILKDIPNQLAFLESMLKNSPDEKAALNRIETISSKGYALLAHIHELMHEHGDRDDLRQTRQEINQNMEEVVKELHDLNALEEHSQISQANSPLDLRQKVLYLVIFAVVSSLVLSATLIFLFNRSSASSAMAVNKFQ